MNTPEAIAKFNATSHAKQETPPPLYTKEERQKIDRLHVTLVSLGFLYLAVAGGLNWLLKNRGFAAPSPLIVFAALSYATALFYTRNLHEYRLWPMHLFAVATFALPFLTQTVFNVSVLAVEGGSVFYLAHLYFKYRKYLPSILESQGEKESTTKWDTPVLWISLAVVVFTWGAVIINIHQIGISIGPFILLSQFGGSFHLFGRRDLRSSFIGLFSGLLGAALFSVLRPGEAVFVLTAYFVVLYRINLRHFELNDRLVIRNRTDYGIRSLSSAREAISSQVLVAIGWVFPAVFIGILIGGQLAGYFPDMGDGTALLIAVPTGLILLGAALIKGRGMKWKAPVLYLALPAVYYIAISWYQLSIRDYEQYGWHFIVFFLLVLFGDELIGHVIGIKKPSTSTNTADKNAA